MPKSLVYGLAAAALLAAAAPASAQGDELQAGLAVPVNESRAVALAAPVAGVAVGNPAVAAVTVQSDRLLFVTGRTMGATNLVAVDAQGRTIFERPVLVTANPASAVMVTRGAETVQHLCAPVCVAAAGTAPAPSP